MYGQSSGGCGSMLCSLCVFVCSVCVCMYVCVVSVWVANYPICTVMVVCIVYMLYGWLE